MEEKKEADAAKTDQASAAWKKLEKPIIYGAETFCLELSESITTQQLALGLTTLIPSFPCKPRDDDNQNRDQKHNHCTLEVKTLEVDDRKNLLNVEFKLSHCVDYNIIVKLNCLVETFVECSVDCHPIYGETFQKTNITNQFKYYNGMSYELTVTLFPDIEFDVGKRTTLIEQSSFPDCFLSLPSEEIKTIETIEKIETIETKFPCHKAILSLVSPTFSARLKSDSWSSNSIVLTKDDGDSQVINCLLSIIYLGSDNDISDNEKKENGHIGEYKKLTESQKYQLLILSNKYLVERVTNWLAKIMVKSKFQGLNLLRLFSIVSEKLAPSSAQKYLQQKISLECFANPSIFF
jgi:hypothetical protein